MSRLVMAAFVALMVSTLAGCGGGEEDPGPQPDRVVRVNESNFNPATVEIRVGQTVGWENRYREPRSVTSGRGPDDPEAGMKFDITLAGYPSGEAIGGKFRFKFDEPDTVHYFNEFLPDGFVGSFSGRVIVTP